MKKIDILRELFDKKLISITNLLLENPNELFSLSQLSSMSNVNISTTLRILDKLQKQGFVEIAFVGNTKFYKLKKGEKTLLLNKFLRGEQDPLLEFLQKIKNQYRIKKVILEEKSSKNAKVLLIGNFIQTERVKSVIEEIKKEHNFKINYVILTEKQFNEMISYDFYDLEKKIIWQEEQSTLKVS